MKFGVQLGLELSDIRGLTYMDRDLGENLHKMLDKWYNGKWRDSNEDGKEIIVRALEKMQRRAIAQKLREKWRDCYCKL